MIAAFDVSRGIPVDLVERFEEDVRKSVSEWSPLSVAQRQRLVECLTSGFDTEPSLFDAITVGRRNMAECVPVPVLAFGGRPKSSDSE